ncbi:MAG: hypothetical protein IJ574_04360 [Bacilli bacterium]|nr:hypothetical protein [Bacilli bacterium]
MKKIICLVIVIALLVGGVFVFTRKDSSKSTNTDNKINEKSNKEKQKDNNKKESTKKDDKKDSNTNKSDSSKLEKNEENIEDYIGVWQYPDSNYPNEELIIKKINSNVITFDYVIDGITTFESVTAKLYKNEATFDVKNEGDWNIKGTMKFNNNTVVFNIEKSSNDNIPVNKTTFTIKSKKSVLQG